MSKIRQDQFGLYVSAGGYKTRPYKETRFKVGDDVKTHHYGGSCHAGVGKSPECVRGKYLEDWLTTGMTTNEKMTPEKERMMISWYKVSSPMSHVMKPYWNDNDRELARKYERIYILGMVDR